MTDFRDVDARPVVKRDQYGRYLLPDPDTGKQRAWTRATTIAGTLKDRYGLERWDQRNIVYGIGQRPALYARAASATLADSSDLDDIAKRAKEAADSHAGADVGTALHTFTERVDRGEDITVPAPYDRDIAAYRNALDAAGMTVALGWIERIVCVPELQIVGTLDRLNNCPEWKLARVGDLKTATDKVYGGRTTNTVLTYGMADIPLQLAIYANASCWWDPNAEQWVDMPAVDRSKAMVIHLPAGLGECRLIEVDIESGWDAVRWLAMGTRDWRKRKDLAETVLVISGDTQAATDQGVGDVKPRADGKGGEGFTPTPVDPPAPPSPASGDGHGAQGDPATASGGSARETPVSQPRLDWLRERVNAIKAHEGARRRLAGLWSLRDEIPTFPKGGPRDDAEIDTIAAFCDLVEMEFGFTFSPDDPALADGPTLGQKARAQRKKANDTKKGKNP